MEGNIDETVYEENGRILCSNCNISLQLPMAEPELVCTMIY
jgi:hypothetical protein